MGIDNINAPNFTAISRFSFTGNGSTNRAIAHSLGKKPQGVLYQVRSLGYLGVQLSDTIQVLTNSASEYEFTATAMDATNVYVGSGAVGSINTNLWVVDGIAWG